MATVVAVVSWIGSNWLASMVVSYAISYAITELTAEDVTDPVENAQITTAGLKTITRSTEEYLRLAYGRNKVGGNQVFLHAEDVSSEEVKDGQILKIDNKVLWIVQALGEGPCEGVFKIFADEKEVYPSDSFDGHIEYWFVEGTSTQVVEPNISGMNGFDDTMKNTCYIVLKLTYNPSLFQSVPRITVIYDGLKVYNFETGVTEFSDNVILCLYDYMSKTRYGMGFSSLKFDLDSWIEAKNAIAAKQWSFNRVYDNMSASKIISDMKKHGRIELVWRDNKWFCYFKSAQITPVLEIKDEHIIQETNGLSSISISEPSRFSVPKSLRVNFVDGSKNFVENSIIVGEDTGGKMETVSLLGVHNENEAVEHGSYLLERAQLNRDIEGKFRGDCLQLELIDHITLVTDALQIGQDSPQEMRVKAISFGQDLTVSLTLGYENANIYNKIYEVLNDDAYTCSLPNPDISIPDPYISIVEEVYSFRERSVTKLHFGVAIEDYPKEWIDKMAVWSRQSTDEDYELLFFIDFDDFYVDNVRENVTYTFKFVLFSIHGTESDFDNAKTMQYTVSGVAERRPPSLPYLNSTINSPNNVTLYSDKINSPDISLYEFRLNYPWNAGLYLAASKSPDLSLAGVKPGSWTFACNTLGTNSLYGSQAKYQAAIIADPPDGWEHNDAWQVVVDDFTDSSAELFNVELNSDGTIQCSHGTPSYEFLDFFDALTCLWKFESDLTATVSSLDLNEEPSGAWTFPSGIMGNCGYKLYNEYAYVQTLGTGPTVSNGITIAFHYEPIWASAGDDAYIICRNSPYKIYTNDNYVFAEFKTDGGDWDTVSTLDDYIQTSYYLVNTKWCHIAVTYDENTDDMSIYVDNVLIASKKHADGGNLEQQDATFVIGKEDTDESSGVQEGSAYGVFSIDELCIFSEALTITQIQQLQNLNTLQGLYRSPILDLASTRSHVLVYLDAVVNVETAGGDWDDVFDSSTSPANAGMTNRSWLELFESSSSAAKVQMKLIYGTSTASWPSGTKEQKKMEILSSLLDSIRYFQIEIRLEDPNETVHETVDEVTAYICERS